jgi:hypothetical protein
VNLEKYGKTRKGVYDLRQDLHRNDGNDLLPQAHAGAEILETLALLQSDAKGHKEDTILVLREAAQHAETGTKTSRSNAVNWMLCGRLTIFRDQSLDLRISPIL